MEQANKKDSFTVDLLQVDGMPGSIHGFLWQEAAGRYKIALNAQETELQNFATFLHEMTHIYYHDMESGRSAADVEAQTRSRLAEALRYMDSEEKLC